MTKNFHIPTFARTGFSLNPFIQICLSFLNIIPCYLTNCVVGGVGGYMCLHHVFVCHHFHFTYKFFPDSKNERCRIVYTYWMCVYLIYVQICGTFSHVHWTNEIQKSPLLMHVAKVLNSGWIKKESPILTASLSLCCMCGCSCLLAFRQRTRGYI